MAERAVPSSGVILFSDLKSAFRGNGGSNLIKMSQFYTSTNPYSSNSYEGGIPASGIIKVSDMRGKGKGYANSFTIGSSVGIWSTRLCRQLYTGPIMLVRRVSDSVLTNFYADRYGNLGTSNLGTGTPIATWLSGTTGKVDTWYDQTTNARHFTQTRLGFQPKIDLYDFNTKAQLNFSNAFFDGHTSLNSTTTLPLDARYLFVLDHNVNWIWHRGNAGNNTQYEPSIASGRAKLSGGNDAGRYVDYTLSSTRSNWLYTRTGGTYSSHLNNVSLTTVAPNNVAASSSAWTYNKPVLGAVINTSQAGNILGWASINSHINEVFISLVSTDWTRLLAFQENDMMFK